MTATTPPANAPDRRLVVMPSRPAASASSPVVRPTVVWTFWADSSVARPSSAPHRSPNRSARGSEQQHELRPGNTASTPGVVGRRTCRRSSPLWAALRPARAPLSAPDPSMGAAVAAIRREVRPAARGRVQPRFQPSAAQGAEGVTPPGWWQARSGATFSPAAPSQQTEVPPRAARKAPASHRKALRRCSWATRPR